MSEIRSGAAALHMEKDELIQISELQSRIKKSRHITPEDWQKLQPFFRSNNSLLSSSALNLAALVDDAKYRDPMILEARQALQKPDVTDTVQAMALRVLWRKNASGWQDELTRIKLTAKKNTITYDEIQKIEKYRLSPK